MFFEELKRLKGEGLLREIRDRSGFAGSSKILIKGIEYINFSSNDYLGLAGSKYLADAAKKTIDEYGFGAGASRLLSGGTELHRELENMTARFKETESALIFNSGYTANTSVIPAIAGEGDIIFSDELNHASIIDGCKLSRAKKVIYRHCDINHLSELIRNEKGNRRIIITDTVFSMDGDIAPLNGIYALCKSLNSEPCPRMSLSGVQTPNSILLYIDDAHGTGVLGNGRGALRHFNINPEPWPEPWIIQMGTFSKALGSYGAFIAGSREITDWLLNTARGFIFSTALPACVIAASMEALRIIQEDTSLISKLWQNTEKVLNGIKDLGLTTTNSRTPILPIITGDVEKTIRFSEGLLKNLIYAPAIKPPTVNRPRIRISITAAHTEEDIERLLNVLSSNR